MVENSSAMKEEATKPVMDQLQTPRSSNPGRELVRSHSLLRTSLDGTPGTIKLKRKR